MSLLKQSTARNVVVFMTDAADNTSGKTGLTLTITASKNGASFSSISPTVTELSNGWYSLALTTGHTDTLGDLALHITASGADPTDMVHEVVLDLPGATVSSVTGAVGSVSGLTASNLDAAISTRLASASYTAPDNTSVTAIKAKTDNLPSNPAAMTWKKNTAMTNFMFPLYSTSGSPATGLTVTAQRSIDGGTLSSCANSVTEISGGLYKIDLATTDLNGNRIAFKFSATGAVSAFATVITES